jgi:hypothetical protein
MNTARVEKLLSSRGRHLSFAETRIGQDAKVRILGRPFLPFDICTHHSPQEAGIRLATRSSGAAFRTTPMRTRVLHGKSIRWKLNFTRLIALHPSHFHRSLHQGKTYSNHLSRQHEMLQWVIQPRVPALAIEAVARRLQKDFYAVENDKPQWHSKQTEEASSLSSESRRP